MADDQNLHTRFPHGIFVWIFVFVFTLVVGITFVVTSISPKSYMSAARIEVRYKPDDARQPRTKRQTHDSALARTETKILTSEVVLRQVIHDLNLNEAWGKEYYNGEILKTWESLKILQDRVFVSSIPETTLIEVRIYDDQPDNAAITANAIAKAYFSYSLTNRSELQVQLVDTAYANKTPCYPKPARNYLIGILSGVFLGLVAATGISLVVFRKNKRLSMKPII